MYNKITKKYLFLKIINKDINGGNKVQHFIDFINEYQSIVFFVFALFIVLFLIIRAIVSKSGKIKIVNELAKQQERLLSSALENFSKSLMEFTDNVLVNKISENYENLISKDLLPTVNESAKVLMDLSEKVVEKQENGMKELAEQLGQLFTERTNEFISEQFNVIKQLSETAQAFNDNLDNINQGLQSVSTQYEQLFDGTNSVSDSFNRSMKYLESNITALSVVMDSTTNSVEKIQNNITQSNEILNSISGVTLELNRSATDSAENLATQNEKIAMLLNDAVNSMQHNTEQASNELLNEFSSTLSNTAISMEGTVSSLNEIVESINNAATNFSEGINETYNKFSDVTGQNLMEITNIINQSLQDEYGKIVTGAQSYSDGFTKNINELSETLEGHISNLQTVTRSLSNTVDNFKSETDSSEERFELGMEQSVSAALNEIDSALAAIVRRLVDVTVSINEAADAIPKAVKAIK